MANKSTHPFNASRNSFSPPQDIHGKASLNFARKQTQKNGLFIEYCTKKPSSRSLRPQPNKTPTHQGSLWETISTIVCLYLITSAELIHVMNLTNKPSISYKISSEQTPLTKASSIANTIFFNSNETASDIELQNSSTNHQPSSLFRNLEKDLPLLQEKMQNISINSLQSSKNSSQIPTPGNNMITPDYQNVKLKAAGTLLYAINPNDKKPYVLLSQEKIWEGPSSGKWKGLGGKKEPNESLVETALRETKEESRGIIDYPLHQIPFDRIISIEHYHCKYLQLMLPIAYDPNITQRFKTSISDNPYFMEKTDLQWIPLEDLMTSIKEIDIIAKEKLCAPSLVNGTIHSGKSTLPLASDFAETMTILLRENPKALDCLSDQSPCSPVTVSDEKW